MQERGRDRHPQKEIAKSKIIDYLSELDLAKLVSFVERGGFPPEVLQDPEVQTLADEWLDTLPDVPTTRLPEKAREEAIAELKRLFKSEK